MSSQSLPNGTAKAEMRPSGKKNRKLRKKAARPQPIMKYAWLAGHVSTLLFGLIFLRYYVVHKQHQSWMAFVGYRLAKLPVPRSVCALVLRMVVFLQAAAVSSDCDATAVQPLPDQAVAQTGAGFQETHRLQRIVPVCAACVRYAVHERQLRLRPRQLRDVLLAQAAAQRGQQVLRLLGDQQTGHVHVEAEEPNHRGALERGQEVPERQTEQVRGPVLGRVTTCNYINETQDIRQKLELW
ncbi:hypothetical protein KL946_004144 [Ogataea haglerorum]|uniref:Uncharacterized protein n=1 Tax=Ogataea haglerorum TaxID=1937702 RepID=A0ABQ7RCW9_9ASCO|nr:hypothetical protein KL946_004144 [Ogataea haglerorum]